jgi:hypothetical protein
MDHDCAARFCRIDLILFLWYALYLSPFKRFVTGDKGDADSARFPVREVFVIELPDTLR